MAYYVKYGNSYLHDLRNDKCVLIDLELECEENSCGYLDFSIYPSHPMYGKLKEHDYRNLITVYENDTLLFTGFIYEITSDFRNEQSIRCKGELDILNQTIVRPFSTYDRGFGLRVPNTYGRLFEWLIDQHNLQVENEKKFIVGINEADRFSDGYDVYYEDDTYQTTIEVISDIFIGNEGVGGYLRIRHENDLRYIDFLCEWTDVNTQVLDFGKNLLDYKKVVKAEDLISFVVPTGAKLKDTYYPYQDGYYVTSDTKPKKDKEYYTRENDYKEILKADLKESDFANQSANGYYLYDMTEDEDGKKTYTRTTDTKPIKDSYYINYRGRYKYSQKSVDEFESGVTYYEYDELDDVGDEYLTISAIADGYVNFDDYMKIDDYIFSDSMYLTIGRLGRHVQDTKIKKVEDLLDYGISVLYEYSEVKYTIEVKAIDMHMINHDLKPISIGEYIRVRSTPHDIDSYFICKSISLDLNNPSQSNYVLGMNYDTLTSSQQRRISTLNSLIRRQIERG